MLTLHIIISTVEKPLFELVLTNEARMFLKSLTKEIRGKKQKMRQVGDMKLYDFEEIPEETFGAVGTPERDEFGNKVDEAIHAYRIGEAIKQARLQQNLTQEQLGERIGVKKSQISKLERGKSITIATMSRVFKALGITTSTLDMDSFGKVAL